MIGVVERGGRKRSARPTARVRCPSCDRELGVNVVKQHPRSASCATDTKARLLRARGMVNESTDLLEVFARMPGLEVHRTRAGAEGVIHTDMKPWDQPWVPAWLCVVLEIARDYVGLEPDKYVSAVESWNILRMPELHDALVAAYQLGGKGAAAVFLVAHGAMRERP